MMHWLIMSYMMNKGGGSLLYGRLKFLLNKFVFSWLCLKNRVLIGDNYRIKGGIGPSVCILCLQDDESIQHIFVECEITQEIWRGVCIQLKLECSRLLISLEENLKLWFLSKPKEKICSFHGSLGDLVT